MVEKTVALCGCMLFAAVALLPTATSNTHFWGVHVDDHQLYQDAATRGEFRCKDSTAVIPTSRVNDDYCDCADGSDEPGTSACTTSKFFCANKGFKSLSVFSSRVNDGVCDCCDGSDEWNSAKKCENTCFVDGKQYRDDLAARLHKFKQALETKKQLVNEAASVKQAKQTELEKIKQQISEAEADITAKTALKDEKEKEEERVRAQKQAEWDAEEDKRIAEAEAQAAANAQATTENTPTEDPTQTQQQQQQQDDGTVQVDVGAVGGSVELLEQQQQQQQQQQQANAEKADFGLPENADADDDENENGAEPLAGFDMNDYPDGQPAETCMGWFQTGGCDPHGVREADQDRACDEWVPKGASGFCLCTAGFRKDYTCDHAQLKCKDVCLVLVAKGGDSTGLDDSATDLNANTATSEGDAEEPKEDPLQRKPMPDYTNEEADAARKALDDANTHKRGLESSLQTIEKDLGTWYGPNDEFRPLRDKCASLEINKYKYEICLYTSANQHDGHSQIRLGSFSSMEFVEDRGVFEMKFTGGQRCWNGPDRSVVLELGCGPEFKLFSADEPEKCVYAIRAEAPAACSDANLAELEKELSSVAVS